MKKKVYPVKASLASSDKDVPLKSAQFTFVVVYRDDWTDYESVWEDIATMIDRTGSIKCVDGWVDEESISDWNRKSTYKSPTVYTDIYKK